MILKYGITLAFMVLITSCLEKRDIVDVSTHPAGWMVQSSKNFHGLAVKSSVIESESCQSCHGVNYAGGTSQVSCYDAQCHAAYPHPDGFIDFASANFHANYIGEQANWDITGCRDCHGADYAGNGSTEKNCLKCHSEMNGPEACNTCHGSSVNDAPPKDLANNTSTTSVGVGAHQAHLVDSTLTTAYMRDCVICHVKPATYNVTGHVNDGSPHAEIKFSAIASDSGMVSPHWDHNSATCSNVYCHGNFTFYRDSSAYAWIYTDSVITGNNTDVVWNSVGTGQADCGTCHGLPPAGHFSAITDCGNCHYHFGPGNQVLDPKLHMNGKIEVY